MMKQVMINIARLFGSNMLQIINLLSVYYVKTTMHVAKVPQHRQVREFFSS
jgi:hypothetical protein